MKSKQLLFFAEKADIVPILEKFELAEQIHYTQTGIFDDANVPEFDSISQMEHLGRVSFGDWNLIQSYLLMPKAQNVILREIIQKNGGVRFAVDQMQNEKSIVIKFGGIYDNSTMVSGMIGTISQDKFSLDSFKLLSVIIKISFSKVKDYYVGGLALKKLKLGWRLVTNSKLPKEYDLKY